jgi:hypothetical protein
MPIVPSPSLRASARPLTLLLLLAACGGTTGDIDQTSSVRPGAASMAESSRSDDDASSAPGGSMTLALEGHAPVTVPVTACAGFGTILTIQGRQGKTVVDLQVVEMPALLEGRTMAESSTAGFTTASDASTLEADEIWLADRITSASRTGQRVELAGVMTGTAWDEVRPGVGGNPRAADGGAEVPFTLTAVCDG